MESLTLVVPCYNEADRLQPDRFTEFLSGDDTVSLCFVDDGSRDDTPARLEQIRRDAPDRVTILSLPQNCGKGEAVRQGLLAAMETGAPAFVGYWDADLATPLATAAAMRRYLMDHPGVDCLLASRVRLLGRDIRRRLRRHYLGRVFATAASLVLDLEVYDTQCGAKLFRHSDSLRADLAEPFLSRWIFDVELLARMKQQAIPDGAEFESHVHEYPLDQWHDIAGSKLRWRDFVVAATDLGRIWWRYR